MAILISSVLRVSSLPDESIVNLILLAPLTIEPSASDL